MVSTMQYLALSQLAYTDFSSLDFSGNQSYGFDWLNSNGYLNPPASNDPNTVYDYISQDDNNGDLTNFSGWTLIAATGEPNGAFAGAAFRGPNGEIVFSFRGTENPSIGDYLADAAIVAMTHSVQFDHAYQFVWDTLKKQDPTYFQNATMTASGSPELDAYLADASNNVTLTGHSLGGGIAQYITYKSTIDGNLGAYAETFNAVGIGDGLMLSGPVLSDLRLYNVVDHVNSRDIVGHFGRQLGDTVVHIDDSEVDYTKVDYEAIAALLKIRLQAIDGVITTAEASKQINDIMIELGADPESYLHTVQVYRGYIAEGGDTLDLFAVHGLWNFVDGDYTMTNIIEHQQALLDMKPIYQLINAIKVIETAKAEGNYHAGTTLQFNSTTGFEVDGVYYYIPGISTNTYTYSYDAIAHANGVVARLRRSLQTGEIAESYVEYQQAIASNVQRVDPLILDLDGDGIETVNIGDSNAFFDLDLNGFAESTSWAKGDDGFLVLDRNQDGIINNANELFGDRTLLNDGATYASSGFQALAEHDTNQDGVIDTNDSVYSLLRIWQDINGDGVSASSELKSLLDLGIVSIMLSYLNTGITDASDNIQVRVGEFTRGDGSTGAIGEYLFNRDTANSVDEPIANVSTEIAALPNIQGTGNVPSLYKAMVDDTTGALQELVEDFIAEDDVAMRNSLMEQILIKWTGSSAVDPASRGGIFDAQKLAVMEKFFGVSFNGNPTVNAVPLLTSSYDRLVESMYASFISETHLKDTLGLLRLDAQDNLSFIDIQSEIDNLLITNQSAALSTLSELTRVLKYQGIGGTDSFLDFRSHYAVQSDEYAKIIDFAGTQVGLGTAGDNSLSTDSAHNALDGGNGNDYLYANTISNVALYGGAGNDTLYGSAGNDILNGGVGNDRIEGNIGNDTYMFGRGYGVDTILDRDTTLGNVDTIRFMNDVASEDVTVRRVGNNLELSIMGTADKLIVEQYFSRYYYSGYSTYDAGENGHKVEKIVFADGTTWTIDDVKEMARTTLGTSGDDSISGFEDQNDIIETYEGSDNIYTGAGNDLITAGTGNDYISGGTGDDTYVFSLGDGQDTIYETDGADTIQLGAGINPADVTVLRVVTGNGYDYSLEISIAGTNDKLTVQRHFGGTGYYGNYETPGQLVEKLVFADGTIWDSATIYTKAHSIVGTAENDYLYGWDGTGFTLKGEAGNDSLSGNIGDDLLYGGVGNDSLSGNSGNDTLTGGTGADHLAGDHGNDTYVFALGDGQDTIHESDGTDTIQFGADIDPTDIVVRRVVGGNGYEYNLELSITGTDDKITVYRHFGGTGYYGEFATPGQVVENITFTDGTTWSVADLYAMVHNVTGTEGDDSFYAWDGTGFTYNGMAGNDNLSGNIGNDILNGGDGNDSLSGNAGNDVLTGGVGADYLAGDTGDDVYVFARGDGQDTIYETDGTDTIQFAAGISPADVMVKRVVGDNGYSFNLELSIAGTDDKLTVQRFFGATGYYGEYATPGQVVENITFADGTIWDFPTIYNTVHNLTGTETEDYFYAWDGTGFTYNGLGGNDNLNGNIGNDTFNGGAGNDSLAGNAGNDTLTGGVGTDYLMGGEGDDTYVFSLGDGQDTIHESNGIDAIRLGEGINPADVTVSRVVGGNGYDYNLELSIAGTDDKITVYRHFGGTGYYGYFATPEQLLEKIIFADGTVWTQDTIYDKVHNVTGTSGDDSFYAWDGTSFTFRGEAGNDHLNGNIGDDILYGGIGNDKLYGSGGNDTHVGGAGADYLSGDSGNDIYVFALGDGQDTIYETDGQDTIQFGAGIDPADINVKRVVGDNGYSYNLELSIAGTDDKITVTRHFGGTGYNGDYAAPGQVIENITFADSTTWSVSSIYDMVHNVTGTEDDNSFYAWDGTGFTYNGLGGNDNLSGNTGNDTLIGGAGNDTLYGAGGNDILNGGTGTDHLQGSEGDDTYVFALGDGQDTIHESSGIDTIQLGAGINPADVTVSRVVGGNGYDYNLELSIAGTGDKLTVYRYFGGSGYNGDYATPGQVVENIVFTDGTVWDGAVIYDKVHNLTGTANDDYFYAWDANGFSYSGLEGNDTLYGNNGGDTLNGNGGNDYIYAQGGGDTLDGGTGNDVLHGGEGNDTYVFGRGYGVDTIQDYAGTDTITFASDITPADLEVVRTSGSYVDQNNLILRIKGTDDSLTIQGYFYNGIDNPTYKIEEFKFADGTTWTHDTIKEKLRTYTGTEGNDVYQSFGDQDLTAYGLDGSDTLYGSSFVDTFYGGNGDDTLFGYSGNDMLDGGTGNDTLYGDAGDDTYVFGRGYGSDIVFLDSSGTDTIKFLEGITPDDLVITRTSGSYSDQNNLVLSIKGTNDQLTIRGYFYGGLNDPAYKIEQFTFANGTVWTSATIAEKLRTYTGTEGNDVNQNFGDQDLTAYGLDGDDTLYGSSFVDKLYGGNGSDTLFGYAGNDTLDGGTGNDTLYGDSGNDTYVFGPGYGSDTIFLDSDGHDTIQFLAGVDPDDITITRTSGSYSDQNNLILGIRGTTDTLTIRGFFYSGINDPAYKIEQFTFADGTVWTLDDIKAKLRTYTGTESNDVNQNFGDQDLTAYGLDGNDTLHGSSFVDTFYGGNGDDYLYTSSGNDTLDGGAGNDRLQGDSGNDTYLFGRGYGSDLVYDYGKAQGDSDVIKFLEGISPEDLVITRTNGSYSDQNNLVLKIKDTNDQLTIQGYFYNGIDGLAFKVGEFHFADGTIWTHDDIKAALRIYTGTEGNDVNQNFGDQDLVAHGLAGDDTLYGSGYQDTLHGDEGNDYLAASSGNDTLDGGTGNDRLYGDSGNDTYVFGRGYGNDTIQDYSGGNGDSDVVTFLAGVAPSDVIVKRVYDSYFGGQNALELSIKDTTDTLTISGYFYYGLGSANYKVGEFRFADGTVWTTETIKEKLRTYTGTEGNDVNQNFGDQDLTAYGLAGDDTLYGSGFVDKLYGGEGNDYLAASSGNDTLDGGAGDDRLYGDSGSDTYVFGRGYGSDTLQDYGRGNGDNDVVQFLAGVSPDDVVVKRVYDNYFGGYNALELSINGTSDKLTLQGYFYYGIDSPNYKVGEFHFSDGTVWTNENIKEKLRTYTGTAGNDSNMNFGDQDLTAYGLAGDDSLTGSGFVDKFYGGDGNDYLSTSSGADLLDGGAGDDILYGDSGSDTYVFGRGYGSDRIQDYSGGNGDSDIVRFLEGVAPSDVLVNRVYDSQFGGYNALELSIAGTQDKLTLTGYFYYGLDSPNYKVSEFQFNDGTVWTRETIKEKLRTYTGTSSNDSNMNFGDQDLTAYGLAGDDTLNGSGYVDKLYGGEGSDYLNASSGNDTLDGGADNDTLYGGYGDDLYVFSGAFGSDQINDYSGNDLVQFTDVVKDSLIFEQVGNKLQISSAGSSNSVAIDYWYQYDDYKVETFKASDGSVISSTQVEQLIQAMASWSANNNGMSWSQALSSNPQDVQSIVSQYWTAPTV